MCCDGDPPRRDVGKPWPNNVNARARTWWEPVDVPTRGTVWLCSKCQKEAGRDAAKALRGTWFETYAEYKLAQSMEYHDACVALIAAACYRGDIPKATVARRTKAWGEL